MANSLSGIISAISKLLSDDKKDPAEAERLRREERFRAEQAMQSSLRQSLREIEARESDLAKRKAKIREMAKTAPEQQLLLEARTIRTQELLVLKMRKIRAGQEQAFLITTALSKLQDFSRGLAAFDKLSELTLDTAPETIDLAVQNTLDELVKLETAYDAATSSLEGDASDRHSAEDRAYLDGLLAPVADVTDEAADQEIGDVLRRISEQRGNLSGQPRV